MNFMLQISGTSVRIGFLWIPLYSYVFPMYTSGFLMISGGIEKIFAENCPVTLYSPLQSTARVCVNNSCFEIGSDRMAKVNRALLQITLTSVNLN